MVDVSRHANQNRIAQRDLDKTLLVIRQELAEADDWSKARFDAVSGMGTRNVFTRERNALQQDPVGELAARVSKFKGRDPVAVMMEGAQSEARSLSDFADMLELPDVEHLVEQGVKEGYLQLVSGAGLNARYL